MSEHSEEKNNREVAHNNAKPSVQNHNGVILEQSYSGPLPPPSHLAKYEEVLPGTADRLLTMAEKSLESSQNYAVQELETKERSELSGRRHSFWLVIIIFLGAVYLLSNDKSIEGLGILLFELVGIVGVLVYNERRRKEDDRSK